MTREIALQLCLDPQGFIFDTQHRFRGITISETGTGYNCVIRATTNREQPVYAMTTAHDPAEGLARLYDALRLGNGDSLWRHDRFASSRGGG